MAEETSKTVSEFDAEAWDPVEERLAVEELQRKLFGETHDEIRVGRYRLHERIAHGGMGVVYRAHDPNLDRDVAIKLIRANRKQSARAHERLLEEAKALAGVSHPNVVEVYDTGSFDVANVFGTGEGAGVFMVMAFVEGQTLQDWLDSPRRWRDVLPPLIAAGQGLVAIHAAGLVHRDFKPGNILMGSPVRVVDFGLATASSLDAANLEVAGTPGYMAPEQYEGEYSEKSDQYSFCASMWRALYGTPKSEAPSTGDRRPPPNSRVPPWLHALVARGLRTDPQTRHANMNVLLAALTREPQRRARWVGVAAGVGVAGTVGFLVGRPTDPRCVNPPLEGRWNRATSDEIRARFLASDLAFAPSAFDDFEAAVDKFADEWSSVRDRTCDLEPSEAREQALTCLRRRELNVLGRLEVYREPDPVLIEGVFSSVDDMKPPAGCVSTTPKTRPSLEPNVDLERAIVFFDLGRHAKAREALTSAEQMITDSRDLARATSLRCRMTSDQGKYEQALQLCAQAWKDAERAGLNRLAARMLMTLAVHSMRTDPARASESLSVAEAKIASMDWAPELRLRAAAVRADLVGRSDLPRAAELLDANIEAMESYYGESTTRTVQDRVNLAMLLQDLGRYEEAVALYDETLTRVEDRLGPNHPHVAAILNNRGTLELLVGQYEDARGHLRQALELKLATPGWNTTRAASTYANLARLYDIRGDLESAEHHARAAFSAGDETPEPYVYATLIRVLRHRGRDQEALSIAREASSALGERVDADVATEFALALSATGEPEAGRKVLLEAQRPQGEDLTKISAQRAALVALARIEAKLGNAEAALAAAQLATKSFAEHPVYPGEWAHACVDMAEALRTGAPERAATLRARAQSLLEEYAPDHPRTDTQ